MPAVVEDPVIGRGAQYTAIGCVTAFAGFFSGAMFAVLLSKMVAGITKAPSCDGIPTCNWSSYFFIGGLIGAISLPAVALWRLRKAHRRLALEQAQAELSDRG